MTTNATVKILTEDDTRGHTALYGDNGQWTAFPGLLREGTRMPLQPSHIPTSSGESCWKLIIGEGLSHFTYFQHPRDLTYLETLGFFSQQRLPDLRLKGHVRHLHTRQMLSRALPHPGSWTWRVLDRLSHMMEAAAQCPEDSLRTVASI